MNCADIALPQRAIPNRQFTNQELLLKTLGMEYKCQKGIIEFDTAYKTPDAAFDNFSVEKRNITSAGNFPTN
jgi:hypothetical protein